MTSSALEHLHSPYIGKLQESGDWAGLIRYWMAHFHEAALDAAVDVIRRRSKGGEKWRALVEFLREVRLQPFDQRRKLPDTLAGGWPPMEQKTINLLVMTPFIAMCEMPGRLPEEHRERLLHIGIQYGEEACGEAEFLGDHALLGFFRKAIAMGYAGLGKPELTRANLREAVNSYRTLANDVPVIFKPYLMSCLNMLGGVEVDLNQLDAARESFRESLALLRQLIEQDETIYKPIIVRVLREMGKIERRLDEPGSAKNYFREAVDILGQLIHERPGAYELDLAQTLHDLGMIEFFSGETARAGEKFEAAVDIYRRQDIGNQDKYHIQMAESLDVLGMVHRELNDLHSSIEKHGEALTIFRMLAKQNPKTYRPDVAFTLTNLAIAQQDLNRLEEAEKSLIEVLSIYRDLAARKPELYNVELAVTLSRLVGVKLRLVPAITGGNVEIETCISMLSEALPIYGSLPGEDPGKCLYQTALTHHNIAALQTRLNQPEAAVNSYRESVRVYRELSQSGFPFERADLGDTLRGLGILQENSNDLEGARENLQNALDIYRELAAQDQGDVQGGLTWTLKALGKVQDRLNQKEAAKESFREALDIQRQMYDRDPGSERLGLARALVDLGNSYRSLNEMKPALEITNEAISLLKPLDPHGDEEYQSLLATALNNAGTIMYAENRPDIALDTIRFAVEIYRNLAHKYPDLLPDLALMLTNLGGIQMELNDLEAADKTLSEALIVRRLLADRQPDRFRMEVAKTLINIGVMRKSSGHFEAALDRYLEATEIFAEQAEVHPDSQLFEHFATWANIGVLYLETNEKQGWPDYSQARHAFRHARECAELHRGRFIDPKHRHSVRGETIRVYDHLIYTCMRIWKHSGREEELIEAIEVAEANRARNLVELLADEALNPANTPEDLVCLFRTQRRELRQSQRRLQEQESSPDMVSYQQVPPAAAIVEQQPAGGSNRGVQLNINPGIPPQPPDILEQLRHEVEQLSIIHNELLEKIRIHDPEFNPDQPVPPIDYPAMQSLVPGDVPTAVIHYSLTNDYGVAFNLTADGIEAISLPDFDNPRANRMLKTWFQRYYESSRDGKDQWNRQLREQLELVYEAAVKPVVDSLDGRGIQRLIIVPNRALHLFPLHACRLPGGRYLSDVYEVVYTPSLSILNRCVSRNRRNRDRLLMVENPTFDLPFTSVETARVSGYYPEPDTLLGSRASKQRLLDNSTEYHVWHYSGHGIFDSNDPLKSALVLGNKSRPEKWLTLRDIFCGLHMRDNLLVVINGCETGMILPDIMDEFVGLPSGFLYAGSACVVSSLWAVNDLSSALIMDHFHKQWRSGKSIGAALREAQRWLRDDIVSGSFLHDELLKSEYLEPVDKEHKKILKQEAKRLAREFPDKPPFAEPVYWAPYVATGLSFPVTRK